MTSSRLYLSLHDENKEASGLGVNIPAVTVGNIADTVAKSNALRAAVQAMTEGEVTGQVIYIQDQDLPDYAGRREQKILVTYVDTTPFLDVLNTIPNRGYGRKFSVEIPCWDRSKVTKLAGKDDIDMAIAPFPAFKAAFEDLALSPYGGAVEIISAVDVGRNN